MGLEEVNGREESPEGQGVLSNSVFIGKRINLRDTPYPTGVARKKE